MSVSWERYLDSLQYCKLYCNGILCIIRSSLKKVTVICWYDSQELLLWLKKNAHWYHSSHFGMRLEGNSPKNEDPKSWLSPSRGVPAHRSVLVRDFLAKDNVTTGASQILSWPGSSWFFFTFFPPPKTEWKRLRSSDTTDIIKNATEELKRISHNGFQE